MATPGVNEDNREVKKIIRRRRTVSRATVSSASFPPTEEKPLTGVISFLSELVAKIEQAKSAIGDLQKKIKETQEGWIKEQDDHEKAVLERNREEELARKREEEEYQYRRMMERKRAEDEFAEKKASWEKELRERKEELGAEKKELSELRERVAEFDGQVTRAVNEAKTDLQKELQERFTNERKLREQEVKSEKDLLNLKIASLTEENDRQRVEIENLRKMLDEATKQLKEIAVKVIEGRTAKIPEPI